MRRAFQLPPGDVAFLNATRRRWECVIDRAIHWVLLRDRPLPKGFDVPRTDMALPIPAMYPDVQIDSVWLSPCPRPLSGPPLYPLTEYPIDGRAWFRLCRHRTKENAWRPGVDDIATHLALVDQWLLQSLRKR